MVGILYFNSDTDYNSNNFRSRKLILSLRTWGEKTRVRRRSPTFSYL